MTIETELPAVKVKAWIDAHLSKMAMLPKRVDEMNEVEAAIFQIVAYHTGFLQFLSSSIGSSTPAESRCEELVKALEQAKKRMRNCRGAVESNQVIDKDVHGSLTNGMADIDSALACGQPVDKPR